MNDSQSRTSPLAIALFAVALCLVCSVMILGNSNTDRNSLSAEGIVAAFCLLAVPIVLVASRKELRLNPLHPISLLALITTLYYSLRGLELAFGFATVPQQGTPERHLVAGCLLITVTVVLYFAGFYSKFGVEVAQRIPIFYFPAKDFADRELWVALIPPYVLGWMSRLFLLSAGVFHFQRALPQIVQQFSALLNDVYAFAFYAYLMAVGLAIKGRAPRSVAIGAGALELGYGLSYGGGTAIFLPLAGAVMLYSYYRRPLRWTSVIAVFLIAIVVIAPFAYLYRYTYAEYVGESGTPGLSSVVGSVERSIDRLSDVTEYRALLLYRLAQLDATLIALDRVPSVLPFQWGGTFVPQIIASPIPRVFWPNKPTISTGRRFAMEFYDDPNPDEEVGSNSSIGHAAELYYNFGVLGLSLCFVIGIFIRFLWLRTEFLMKAECEAAPRIWFVLLTAPSINLVLAMYFTTLARGAIVLLLFLTIVYRRLPTKAYLHHD